MKILLVLLFTASLSLGDEPPKIKAVAFDQFSAKVPTDWTVSLASESENNWTYVFSDENGMIFEAEVWRGKSFKECFCAPWKDYRTITRAHEEVRTIRIGDLSRTLKIAGSTFSMDVHAFYKKHDTKLVDAALASITTKHE